MELLCRCREGRAEKGHCPLPHPLPGNLASSFHNGLEAPLMIVVIIVSLSYPLPRRVDRWTRWEPTFRAWNVSSVRSELSPRPRPCTVPYRTVPHRTVRAVWTALGTVPLAAWALDLPKHHVL